MAGSSSAIDLDSTTSRSSSSPVPQNHTSNLTSALQGAAAYGPQMTSAVNIASGNDGNSANGRGVGAGRHDSFGGGGGARPISMKGSNRDRPRRESVAGSMVGAMSWGGVSVGSWIRDEIIMTGTSPFTYQTPSYYSSSYFPKMEADFMRDFCCCNLTLPSMHDLLHHYEVCHAEQTTQILPLSSQNGQTQDLAPVPDSRAAVAAGTAAAVQRQAQMEHEINGQYRQAAQQTGLGLGGGGTYHMNGLPTASQQMPGSSRRQFRIPLQPVQDIDVVGVMDMDEEVAVRATAPPVRPLEQTQFARLQRTGYCERNEAFLRSQLPQLNLADTSFMSRMQGHNGLRNSQPTTPLQHNPTVSSVNTPTLCTQPLQQRQLHRGTLDMDNSTPVVGDFHGSFATASNGLSTPIEQPYSQNNGLSEFDFGNGNEMLELCIDEPARRLFSPNGALIDEQQYELFRAGLAQIGDEPSSSRGRRRRQTGNGDDFKPFKCPVIGCEKAYKNQNGLKYHKTHGHTNQQLHENGDGTFSIVNPETRTPYPGTLGMEKEKPYGCEFCGKRYKNLNGLKYHKSHSPPCNPERRPSAASNVIAAAGGTGSPGPSTGLPINSTTVGIRAPGEHAAFQ